MSYVFYLPYNPVHLLVGANFLTSDPLSSLAPKTVKAEQQHSTLHESAQKVVLRSLRGEMIHNLAEVPHLTSSTVYSLSLRAPRASLLSIVSPKFESRVQVRCI